MRPSEVFTDTFEGHGIEEGAGFISHYNNDGSVYMDTLTPSELREQYPDHEIEGSGLNSNVNGYFIDDEDSDDEDSGCPFYEGNFISTVLTKGKRRKTWFDDLRESWDAHRPDGTQHEIDLYYVKIYNELFEKL